MAMTIRNNRGAMKALGQLKKNDSSLGKQLKKVSTGMKINDAGDDASGYSISERMRAKIRALSQCNDNASKGKNLLDLASATVDKQVELMRTLFTITMKASDDTYTDSDRAILQKEATQTMDQIELLAQDTTYNGIQLLNQRTTTIKMEDGLVFEPTSGYVKNSDGFIALSQIPSSGADYSVPKESNGSNDIVIDFDSIFNNASLNIPADLHGKGFSLQCQACSQFVTFYFDANSYSSTRFGPEVSDSSSRQPICYKVGVAGVQTAKDLEAAVFNAVYDTTGVGTGRLPSNSDVSTQIALIHSVQFKYDASAGQLHLYKQSSGLTLKNGLMGDFIPGKIPVPYNDPKQYLHIQSWDRGSQNTMIELPNTTLSMIFPDAKEHWNIQPELKDYPKEWPAGYENLTIAEKQRKWLEDTWQYPADIVTMDLNNCVTTRERANKFLEHVNQGIKYLLSANTTLGAQSARMEFMSANLTTATEQTQASESTIRDANMAKEMTEYTKSNVLMQAAQSMLAQANQSGSNVLSLLQ